jgi:hypothetical protein
LQCSICGWRAPAGIGVHQRELALKMRPEKA